MHLVSYPDPLAAGRVQRSSAGFMHKREGGGFPCAKGEDGLGSRCCRCGLCPGLVTCPDLGAPGRRLREKCSDLCFPVHAGEVGVDGGRRRPRPLWVLLPPRGVAAQTSRPRQAGFVCHALAPRGRGGI